MQVEPSGTAVAWLIPLSVENVSTLKLEPAPEGIVLGRHESCDLHVETAEVSRVHARFTFHESAWRVADLRSLHGTWVNGVRVPRGTSIGLRGGDLLRIGMLYRFSHSLNDGDWQATSNDIVDVGIPLSPREDFDNADIPLPKSEYEMAQNVLDALAATDLFHAAMVQYKEAGRQVRVLASYWRQDKECPVQYAQALMRAASEAHITVTRRCDQLYGPPLAAAAAFPIALHNRDVDCVLYVSAGDEQTSIDSAEIALCRQLARWAERAIERLRASDVAAQLGAVEVEHARAAEVQRRLLPARTLIADTVHCVGRIEPGYQLAGDFFDIVHLAGGRVAVALGDVSGKGIVASVLAAAAMGYLRSALETHADPLRCVYALNRYVASHANQGMFLTLWLGVLDAPQRVMQYVDAGHGYAALIKADHSPVILREHGGPPLGIMADATYEAGKIELEMGDRLLVISDGIVEQRQRSELSQGRPLLFGFDQAVECLGSESRLLDIEAAVDEVFSRVQRHASSRALDDDATAIAVQINPTAPQDSGIANDVADIPALKSESA